MDDIPINLWKFPDTAILTEQGTMVILAGKGPLRVYASRERSMNKDDILTDEQQLGVLIRDAMSGFIMRRLGVVSVDDDPDEVMTAAMEYAASKIQRDEHDTSDHLRELRAKHVKQKAVQTIARCQAADRLYQLSTELAGVIVEIHKRTLAIVEDLNGGPKKLPSENICVHCGKHRNTHIGQAMSCFGGMGTIFRPQVMPSHLAACAAITESHNDPPEPEDTSDDPYNEYPGDFRHDE